MSKRSRKGIPWRRFARPEYREQREARGWSCDDAVAASKLIVGMLPADLSLMTINVNGLANPFASDDARAIMIYRIRSEYQGRKRRA